MEDISDSHVSSILSQSLHWFFQTLLLSSLRRIRTLLGFTTKVVLCNLPGKSLYNTVRELVENALDSAESIGELPLVEITIWRDVKMRAFDDANHQTYVDLKIFKSFSEFFVGTWWYRIQEWSYFILKELLYADPFDVEAQKKMRNNNIEAIMDRRLGIYCI
ncbi:unnamed protein product [Lactuca saligna]|uniref:Histidine kinase/HSP90-like ATPase domain-containing protein n=1 Tax=Lactuca saligna TaxID=75948 RepID=A0AA36A0Q7_LACSI|nr:unnamed protein product [Lactuca saligna]